MIPLNRLGLGCMGMSSRKNPQQSIDTIQTALRAGITLLNTGEFYNGGESEIIVGRALQGVPRDSYFLSVKFGVLPLPGGGIYGLDVQPFHVKAHLAYSLNRLGLDYVDLYQPARIDTAIPVEETIGAIADLVKQGYVRHIGLSQVNAETLRRAHAVHPIHTVEVEYSLIKRDIEHELISTAQELGVTVLAYGALGHGLLTDRFQANMPSPNGKGKMENNNMQHNLPILQKLQTIAAEKGVSLSNLAIAWTLTKYPHVQSLIGTTNPAHLLSALEALHVELSSNEIDEIECAAAQFQSEGLGSRNYRFTNGVMYLDEACIHG